MQTGKEDSDLCPTVTGQAEPIDADDTGLNPNLADTPKLAAEHGFHWPHGNHPLIHSRGDQH